MARCAALLLAGGKGIRAGGKVPKQYQIEGDRMIIMYSLQTLLEYPEIDAVQIVAEFEWQKKILKETERISLDLKKRIGFSVPGENRQLSIWSGLKDIYSIMEKNSYVLIHDAARPCLKSELIADCFRAAIGHDGAMPALPMRNTVYISADGQSVSALLNRNEVYAGQAPEVFAFEKYFQANTLLTYEEKLSINGSTEPAVMAGMDIAIFPGDENNIKITTKKDLEYFREQTSMYAKGKQER